MEQASKFAPQPLDDKRWLGCARAIFERAPLGIAQTALDGRFLDANPRLCRMLGYTEQELLRLGFRDVTHPADAGPGADHLARLLEETRAPGGGLRDEVEKRYLRKDGSVLWSAVSASLVSDVAGRPEYFIVLIQDITWRKEAQARLEYQANYDALTDLPNRLLLGDRLGQALSQAKRKGWTVGVLFLNLDQFKTVNDTLGHDAGDDLLKQVAGRLAGALRTEDTVARVGGDEFIVVLPDLTQARDAARLCRRIESDFSQPFLVGSQEVFLSASIGIALFPADGQNAESLINNSYAAMYRAKKLGRSNFRYYTAEMNERAIDRLLLETDLRRALERKEFLLHYQPKVSLETGEVTGLEALMRWDRAGTGLVSPAQFIPVLEDSGLIVPAGEWAIEAVCRQIRQWDVPGARLLPVAVNLSAKQFLQRDIAATVQKALADHGVASRLLVVEITESAAMQNPQEAARILSLLRDRGVRVHMDDFGTGYSSLGYIKRLPLDTLKLDRSFVTGLPDSADDASIARAVIAMAHSLGLTVVAEGVETEGQRAFLAAIGCDEMQGYLFSRPLPADACAELLRRAPRGC